MNDGLLWQLSLVIGLVHRHTDTQTYTKTDGDECSYSSDSRGVSNEVAEILACSLYQLPIMGLLVPLTCRL